ncbi:MAG: helix-turn-helix domain-containing protein [Nevskiaceae bacterium]|nr:helix-turn-helix domain-containing protein [Nevskiaceae bacterium]
MSLEESSPAARREVMGGLAKGIDVLRAFSRDRPHMTLSEVAACAGLPPATARRCLNTFQELGYVTRSGRKFLLRPKVLEISAAYLESMDIEQLTQTHLEQVARETGDSAALSVLDGVEVVYVARTSVRTLMRMEAHVGSRFPAYATSMGRVLLAGLGPARLRWYFENAHFTALTSRTVTDPAKLARIVAESRRNGCAVVDEELALGVIAIAVPVYDGNGRVVAALNSSSHARRTDKAALVRERLPMLQQISRQISAEIARVPGIALSAQL